jgi:hypothetical protein
VGVVRRAEELGLARAWFYDTQMLSADPFVAMGAAAIKTTKIRLGTVTAELIRRTTYTATEKEIKERFAALAAAGYSEVAVQIVPGQDWGRIRRAFA